MRPDLPPLTPWQLQLQRWGLDVHCMDPPLGPHSLRDGALGFAMRRTDWTLWSLVALGLFLTTIWVFGVLFYLVPDPEFAMYLMAGLGLGVMALTQAYKPEVHYGMWVEAREVEIANGRKRVVLPLDQLQRVTPLHRNGYHGVVLHCGPEAYELWLARDRDQAEAIVAWFTRFLGLYRRRWGSAGDVPVALRTMQESS